jgi:hypothetical protein
MNRFIEHSQVWFAFERPAVRISAETRTMLNVLLVVLSFFKRISGKYCHVYVRDYRRGLDWWMDLLTTYTHDSELQAITAPLLISTIHQSPQHPLSLFPACCVFTSRSLVTASNSGDSSASGLKSSLNGGSLPTDPFLHRLPYRTDLVAPNYLSYNSSARTA